MIEDVQKAEKWKPGPIYMSHPDWNNSIIRKGKFGKYPKKSFVDEIVKVEEKRPGPVSYSWNKHDM